MIVKCHFLFQSIIPTFDLISAIRCRLASFRPNPLSCQVYSSQTTGVVYWYHGRGMRPSWVSTEVCILPICWHSRWAPPVSICFCNNVSIFPFHGCQNSKISSFIITWRSYRLERSGNLYWVLIHRSISIFRYCILFSVNEKSEVIVTLYIEREVWKF